MPQGSVLGVFLFNAIIDNFETASNNLVPYPVVGGGPAVQAPPPRHERDLDKRPKPEYGQPGLKTWKSLFLSVLKYVDDNILHEKLFMDGAVTDEDGKKKVRAVRSQNLFRRIMRIAELMGMKGNTEKTKLLCI